MRKGILGGIALAFIGLGVATPAAAADWRVCVVGACMKAGGCGDHDASVAVSMQTDVTDPEVGGTDGLVAALMRYLTANNRSVYGDPLINCTPSQPDEETARRLAVNISSEMSQGFYEVSFRSPNDMFPGYQQREHN
jgi:hypothetical protein